MKMRPSTTTAVLYLVPSIASIASLYEVLIGDNPPGVTARDNLRYFLLEAPQRHFFAWQLFALPLLLLGLGIAYVSPLALTRTGSRYLFALGALLAVVSWFTAALHVAIFTSVPLIFGLLALLAASNYSFERTRS